MPTADDPAQPSTELFEPAPEQIGRYRILDRLGEGGMGTVYRAHDPHLDRMVAIKLPRFDTARDRDRRVQRFQREARTAASVWHPHICPIYDVGEHEGQPFVVMPCVEGKSLAERLAAGRFEEPAEAVTLALQLLDALAAVHARGIVHRDLKPGNVMLDPAGRAILMDFGLARPEQEAERLTTDGVVLGTPAYMAPEQAAGQTQRLGPWTDVYALGVVLYQMLTGRLPFEGPALTVLARILHEALPPPRTLRPDLDPALEGVLLRALARECEGRYQSAAEFGEALRRWLRASRVDSALVVQPLAAPVADATSVLPTVRLANPPGPRRPWILVLAADWVIAVGIALVGGGAAFFLVSALAGGSGGPERGAGWGLCFGVPVALMLVVLVALERQARRSRLSPARALLDAAERGQLDQVRKWIRQGTDLNVRDEMGETPLMKAAHHGYIGTVKLLLANGASVNEKNPFGETALTIALRQGREYIAELLRQAGAKP
ncbi:MAG: protein kinase [Gemmataceae bacterium]|nr:protein kinase [Gemmataceae bacterium]